MNGFIETDNFSCFKVDRQAYILSSICQRELEAVFDKIWLYLAHTSELPTAGDFLTRDVGGRNLILQRQPNGELGVFRNACSHRGARICSEPRCNTQRFTCPYHGWTYDSQGALVGQPDRAAYQYRGQCDLDLSLTRMTHSVYKGFVFIHFARKQNSLEEHLGQAAEYIDLILDQSDDSLEIIPGAFDLAIQANWKLLAESGVDAYHLPFAHKRYLEYLNTLGTDPASHKRTGQGLSLGNGHGLIMSGPPSTGRPIAYWSPLFPDALKASINAKFERLVQRFGQARTETIAHTNKSMFIFPNLVINDLLALNIRTFFPSSPRLVNITVAAQASATRAAKSALRGTTRIVGVSKTVISLVLVVYGIGGILGTMVGGTSDRWRGRTRSWCFWYCMPWP